MKISNEIAEANNSDVNEVHEKLINIWLPGSEQHVTHVDPNQTFDFGEAVLPSTDEADKDIIVEIPYMDSSISR